MNYTAAVQRLVSCIFSILIGAGILLAQGNPILDSDTVVFTSSNLPIILIDTHGDSILPEPKITADMKIIYNVDSTSNSINDTTYDYNGTIGIEIRGESSRRSDKKQYGIETRDPSGSGTDISLLGLPAESDWVLYAASGEKTFIRDFLAYRLSRTMGRYASRAHHCELVLNGRYRGIYILFENIKRGESRVNISKIEGKTGDKLTGGYIVRIDRDKINDPNSGWFSSYPPYDAPAKQIHYEYYYPQSDEIVSEQRTYIQYFLNSFETVMNSPGYADTISGYSNYLDVGSAVDHFLLNELTKNINAYRLSTYLYKDKNSNGGKLTLGPVWDFTDALGNSVNYLGALTEGWELTYLTTNQGFLNFDDALVPFWWKKLFDDPEFIERVKNRWIGLRSNQFSLETIYGIIDSTAGILDEAQQRNFVKWPPLESYTTYTEDVEYLKDWLYDRIAWMDVALTGNSLDVDDHTPQSPSTFIVYQNYPNPFNPSTTIMYYLPKKSFVTVKIFDVLGKEVATIVAAELPAGRYSRAWDASGMPSGVYYCRISAGSSCETTKLLLCK